MTFASTTQLLSGVTATGAGSIVYPQRRQDELGKIQAKIVSGTATVKIQGRANPDAPWATLLTAHDFGEGLPALAVRLRLPFLLGGPLHSCGTKANHFFLAVCASLHNMRLTVMHFCTRFVASHLALVEPLCVIMEEVFENFVVKRSPHGYLGLLCLRRTLFLGTKSWGLYSAGLPLSRVPSRSAFHL